MIDNLSAIKYDMRLINYLKNDVHNLSYIFIAVSSVVACI